MACSGIGPIAGMDLLVVVVTVCEVGPAETGLCEVGPAETGLARSASCRSDGRRARVRARAEEGGCALLLSDGREPVDLKFTGAVPRAQWLRAPHPALSAGRRGGNLLLFSLSNTNTSYGDRYLESESAQHEELNSRSTEFDSRGIAGLGPTYLPAASQPAT